MKLLVPFVGKLHENDLRLLKLAGFLGLETHTVALNTGSDSLAAFTEGISQGCSCLAVQPTVLQPWFQKDSSAEDLTTFLLSRFSHLIVHGIRSADFDRSLVVSLSRGMLRSIDHIDSARGMYTIARDVRPICGSFSGISFGPVNATNDHVFSVAPECEVSGAVVPLISIAGKPFMAKTFSQTTEMFFIASENVADLSSEVDDAALADYFSQLVPHAMALRHVAGQACWRPLQAHATIVVDDPPLRKSYGFVNFDSLLARAERDKFHVAIAFIPYNFNRNSPRIVKMFRDHAAHLSICVHGNDHTGAEFASKDSARLNAMLEIAESRISSLVRSTGLSCDKVMVFPQGNFSIPAMETLKARWYIAAVNTVPHPQGEPNRLTLGELAQPAVLRYGDFPLFLRKSIVDTQDYDVAFNVFFGRPVLVGEHHDLFRRPESLTEFAELVRQVEPDVQWSNLAHSVGSAKLVRRTPDGREIVRSFTRPGLRPHGEVGAQLPYEENCHQEEHSRISIQPSKAQDRRSHISKDARTGGAEGINCRPAQTGWEAEQAWPARSTAKSLGFGWNCKVFARRRLSEIRDNYLSKNEALLAFAKVLQRRFLRI